MPTSPTRDFRGCCGAIRRQARYDRFLANALGDRLAPEVARRIADPDRSVNSLLFSPGARNLAPGQRPMMRHEIATIVQPESVSWLVERSLVPGDNLALWCAQANFELTRLAKQMLLEVTDGTADLTAERLQRLGARIWHCLQYHGQLQAETTSIDVNSLASWLDLRFRKPDNASLTLPAELALCESLEAFEPRAVDMFENRYMPAVRATARRVGRAAGEELVENFAATLALPREGGVPRIRQFQGRTSLPRWLKVVVTNLCLSDRRRRLTFLVEAAEVQSSQPHDAPFVGRDCGELLRPVFRSAVAEADASDRLLVKLLLLDEISQQTVARSLGIHSGNVTRRKQKIMQNIWRSVRAAAESHPRRGDLGDCLDGLVAGHDRQLREELALLLGVEFRAEGGSIAPEDLT